MTDSEELRARALTEAAALAFAMIRFEEGAAHLHPGHVPPGMPRVGIDYYRFGFSRQRILRESVISYLASLPSPALIAQTTTRGRIAFTLLSELSGERLAAARHAFANQCEALEVMARQLELAPDSRILLEFDEEEFTLSFRAMREWSERFAVQVGWNLSRLHSDERASARLNLMRSDGTWSLGTDCPV
jgi:hypothetical protein